MSQKSTKPAIDARNIKKYYKNVHALDGVSIMVKKGKIFGLLGPNGAGKTTLVKAMTTLLKPDSGSLNIGGMDAISHPGDVRKIIGLAGQYASVDEVMTGRENIEMVGRLYHINAETVKKRTEDILKRFELTEAADRPVKTYSGGMRRRLDLGASLVGEPEILFLDEPTTGLDPRTRLELWKLIRQLNDDGVTILLTTQYLDEADELADYIALIDQGKLITEGTADELKSKLGDDVIEITLTNAKDAKAALPIVEKSTHHEPLLKPNGKKITVKSTEGTKGLSHVIKHLDDAGIKPSEVSLHRPTLDDVFLELTGKPTSEGEGEPNA